MEHLTPPLISVVVPVYNNAGGVLPLVEAVKEAMQRTSLEYEIILVADGCRDNSWEKICEVASSNTPVVKGIKLARNSGQHHALLCGLAHISGNYAVTLDDDLQYDPTDISQLLETAKQNQADLVYGLYKKRNHNIFRQTGSYLVSKLLHHYAGGTEKGSSFKLIRADLVQKIILHNHPYVFIDQLLHWCNIKTAYCEVAHRKRSHGSSTYNIFSLSKMTFQLLIGYTVLPLRLITWFGMTAFLISLCLIAYFIFNKLVYGSPLGFTALIVSIFLTGGITIFSIGILGEYLGRLIQMQYNRPGYIIAEKMNL